MGNRLTGTTVAQGEVNGFSLSRLCSSRVPETARRPASAMTVLRASSEIVEFRVVGGDQDRRASGWKGNGDIVDGPVVAAAGLVADPPVGRQAGAQAAGARLAGEQPADQAIAR